MTSDPDFANVNVVGGGRETLSGSERPGAERSPHLGAAHARRERQGESSALSSFMKKMSGADELPVPYPVTFGVKAGMVQRSA
jgi:hypothetical protein